VKEEGVLESNGIVRRTHHNREVEDVIEQRFSETRTCDQKYLEPVASHPGPAELKLSAKSHATLHGKQDGKHSYHRVRIEKEIETAVTSNIVEGVRPLQSAGAAPMTHKMSHSNKLCRKEGV